MKPGNILHYSDDELCNFYTLVIFIDDLLNTKMEGFMGHRQVFGNDAKNWIIIFNPDLKEYFAVNKSKFKEFEYQHHSLCLVVK